MTGVASPGGTRFTSGAGKSPGQPSHHSLDLDESPTQRWATLGELRLLAVFLTVAGLLVFAVHWLKATLEDEARVYERTGAPSAAHSAASTVAHSAMGLAAAAAASTNSLLSKAAQGTKAALTSTPSTSTPSAPAAGPQSAAAATTSNAKPQGSPIPAVPASRVETVLGVMAAVELGASGAHASMDGRRGAPGGAGAAPSGGPTGASRSKDGSGSSSSSGGSSTGGGSGGATTAAAAAGAATQRQSAAAAEDPGLTVGPGAAPPPDGLPPAHGAPSPTAQAGPDTATTGAGPGAGVAVAVGTGLGAASGAGAGAGAAGAGARPLASTRLPWGIAHRGASAELPEHTVEGYRRAVEEGADFIECDVVLSTDLVPFCRHEPNLLSTTDAAAKFPDRMRSYVIDGENVTGIFSFDLTAAEIGTLRAVQPWPFRDQSFNGRYKVASLAEYVGVALSANRSVGIYPETKNPTFVNALFRSRGAASNTTLEDVMLAALAAAGHPLPPLGSGAWRRRPVFLQSFEASSLRLLAQRTCAPTVLLLGDAEGWVAPDSNLTLAQLTTDEALAEAAQWAAAVGPAKATLVTWQPAGAQQGQQGKEAAKGAAAAGSGPGRYVSSGLVERFHAHGLQVHPYTLRPEPRFFLPHLAEHAGGGGGGGEAANVSVADEYELLLVGAGADAVFADHMPSFRQWLAQRGVSVAAARAAARWSGARKARAGAKWRPSRPAEAAGGAGTAAVGAAAGEPGKLGAAKSGGAAAAAGAAGGAKAAAVGGRRRLARDVRAQEHGGDGPGERELSAGANGRVWDPELKCEVYRPPSKGR
ncbi:hypothetical protein HYH03_002161 [Edaphochlamys debaryana]|uniref:glycerophosphodiester phosphodiesterase n=1 Tax=Edaphochlamys debaryana TaxID=47281 RepID=A0A836C4I0_9CHLO|nr:hypothetical protein HYH03_002161 [Edaphochlamys debaryana]|eukprot:KAG2499870.1 hypothetical protein HYH03_002161 [Edaphochlamys debaryana]